MAEVAGRQGGDDNVTGAIIAFVAAASLQRKDERGEADRAPPKKPVKAYSAASCRVWRSHRQR
jgi:hypothetical protein